LDVGSWGPYVTERGLGRGLPSYQVASRSIQPFGNNRHGPKYIGGLCPLLGMGAGSPSNTMSLGPRPTSLLSGTLILPAVWPQQIWAENWGRTVPHLTQRGHGRGLYLRAKFHLDPSNRLAAIHKCYRQDRQRDRQRSDSIGRTVLQKVAQ